MTFSHATAVEELGDGRYAARLHDGWDIMGITNGGYMMAIAARAMIKETDGRVPVSVTGHFLNPGRPGDVEIEVTELKSGRTFTTQRAVMSSGGKTVLSVTGSLSGSAPGGMQAALMAGSPPDLPPPDECIKAASASDAPFPPPMVDRVDLRVHPDDALALLGTPSGSALVRGWFRLADDEPIDALAVLLSSDAFPPAIFNTDLPMTWTPTLDLTVHVRHPGPHAWLRCSFRTRFVTGGFLEEDGEIWDDRGNLVALSRQLALVGR